MLWLTRCSDTRLSAQVSTSPPATEEKHHGWNNRNSNTQMFWKLSQKLTGFRTTWTLQAWLSIWKKYPVFVCCCCCFFFNPVPSGSLCNLNYDLNAWLCQTHFGFPTNTTPQAPHPETPIKPVWPGCIMNGVIFFQLFWQGLCKVFSFTFISDIGQ